MDPGSERAALLPDGTLVAESCLGVPAGCRGLYASQPGSTTTQALSIRPIELFSADPSNGSFVWIERSYDSTTRVFCRTSLWPKGAAILGLRHPDWIAFDGDTLYWLSDIEHPRKIDVSQLQPIS